MNQLRVSGNACGPASLLNAFALGSEDWRRAASTVKGESDRERLSDVIRRHGMKPSVRLRDRKRWQARAGVNLEDLAAMANDMIAGHWLPAIELRVFLPRTPEETPELLRAVHRQLAFSLKKGLPPVISLRRHVLRAHRGGRPVWTSVHGHFVTLTGLPARLPRRAAAFPVVYVDPWGGRVGRGEIRLPSPATASLGLVADFPQVSAGRDLVKEGEATALTLSAALGRF